MNQIDWLKLLYLLSAVLFIFGLKMLASVKTAPRGNLVSALGMLVACIAVFFQAHSGSDQNFLASLKWILIALIIGTTAGLLLASRIQMTGMPQMVGLFNGFGGIASLLVATGDYVSQFKLLKDLNPSLRGIDITQWNELLKTADPSLRGIDIAQWHVLLATGLATLVGGVTFTGSLVAFGKLQGLKLTPSGPVQFPGQKVLVGAFILSSLILCGCLVAEPTFGFGVILIALLAAVLGVLLVIGIGGADMPVVIALLNSYSGIAAAMAGFVLSNYALIITGSLVGASGLVLTSIMCKAMNRSLMNVLFGGVGFEAASPGATVAAGNKQARPFVTEDAAIVLEAAQQVVIVPGYGMAVAQAQHAVKELADELQNRSITVKYAIHPVAGRMPGHMNVLLAEAGVPYEQLCDLEQINPEFEQTDVALIIGANDVTNPAARNNRNSPIYGMPILDVDKAKTVFVVKRSLNPGFAGIENALYFADNCGMIFGDAKQIVTQLTSEVQQL